MPTLLHLLLPLDLLGAADPGGVIGLAVALLLVAVAVIRCRPVSGSVRVGDLVTASRRLRGSFRRSTRPDSPGRPQARAPGSTSPA